MLPKKNEQNVSMPKGMKTSKTFTSGGRLLPECTLKNGGAPGPLGDYIMQTSP